MALLGAASVLLPPRVTRKLLPVFIDTAIEAASVSVVIKDFTGPATETMPSVLTVLVKTTEAVKCLSATIVLDTEVGTYLISAKEVSGILVAQTPTSFVAAVPRPGIPSELREKTDVPFVK